MDSNNKIKYKKIENVTVGQIKLVQLVNSLKPKKLKLISINANLNPDSSVTLKYYIEQQNSNLLIINISLKKKQIASLYTFFSNADFIEREIAEFFGVKFVGNPNLKI